LELFVDETVYLQTNTLIDRRRHMFGWAVTFLIIALIAGALGFGGIAGTAVGLAKLVFYIGLVLFLVAMVYALITGRKPPVA